MDRPPLDAATARLVRGGLSRRSVLSGAGAAGLAAALAACSTGTSADPIVTPTAAVDRSAEQKKLRWANWTLYLDYDEDTKTYPTLQAFDRRTGMTTTYSPVIEDNDTFTSKVAAPLAAGRDIGEDLIVLSDWMVNRYVRQGWVQKLDHAAMPHVTKNLRPQLRDVDYDPGRMRSVTWQSGFGVLAWNKEKVPGGLHQVSDLWAPELKGRVEVLSEMRDTMGLILLEQGVDIGASFTDDQFSNGLDVLQKQIDSGQIRQVKGNTYQDDLVAGEAWAAIGWSGDIFQINAEHGDKWGYAIPEAGGTYWSDNLMVPIGSPHLTNAEKLIDYYYEPAVAAKVAAYVNYVCPVVGAQAAMEKIDHHLADSEWIFPSDEFLSHTTIFVSLPPDKDTLYSQQFQNVIGS